MKRSQSALDQLFATQIQVLATTFWPKTVKCYRYCVRDFLAYLHTTFPHLHKLSQLHRDPHLLSWFRFLCQQYPPPRNRYRELHLLTVGRLLRDLADQGHSLTPDLIRGEDFPPRDHYLPDRFLSRRINNYETAPSHRHPGGQRSPPHAGHRNPHR